TGAPGPSVGWVRRSTSRAPSLIRGDSGTVASCISTEPSACTCMLERGTCAVARQGTRAHAMIRACGFSFSMVYARGFRTGTSSTAYWPARLEADVPLLQRILQTLSGGHQTTSREQRVAQK